MHHLTRSLLMSVAAIATLGFFVASCTVPIVQAIFRPTPAFNDPVAVLDELVAAGDADMELWQRRVNGRSSFHDPPMRPVPRDPAADEEKITRRPSPSTKLTPPPPPRTPPDVVFIVGDTVYFEAFAGNENAAPVRLDEELDGLRVIEIRAPWFVRVSYDGHEHELPVFGEPPQFLSSSE
jgi:hypothetical protein